MKEQIKKHLAQIEREKEIKILLACETGSRAWGFPSPDSDYDIRMIYVHPTDWYLSLTEKKDTIEQHLADRIKELIALKATVGEAYLHQEETDLLDFIQDCIAAAEENAQGLPSARGEKEDVDRFYRKTLAASWI